MAFLFNSPEDRESYIQNHPEVQVTCSICDIPKLLGDLIKSTSVDSQGRTRWSIGKRCKACRKAGKVKGRGKSLIPERFLSAEDREQWAEQNHSKFVCHRCECPKRAIQFKRITVRSHSRQGLRRWWKFDSICRDCESKWSKDRQRKCSTTIAGALKWRLIAIRSRCKQSGVKFDLTTADLLQCWEKQKGKCHYSGRQLQLVDGKCPKDGVTVDRIDPKSGYCKDNVVLCTRHVNTIKSNLAIDEFAQLVTEIFQRKEIWYGKHPSEARKRNITTTG